MIIRYFGPVLVLLAALLLLPGMAGAAESYRVFYNSGDVRIIKGNNTYTVSLDTIQIVPGTRIEVRNGILVLFDVSLKRIELRETGSPYTYADVKKAFEKASASPFNQLLSGLWDKMKKKKDHAVPAGVPRGQEEGITFPPDGAVILSGQLAISWAGLKGLQAMLSLSPAEHPFTPFLQVTTSDSTLVFPRLGNEWWKSGTYRCSIGLIHPVSGEIFKQYSRTFVIPDEAELEELLREWNAVQGHFSDLPLELRRELYATFLEDKGWIIDVSTASEKPKSR